MRNAWFQAHKWIGLILAILIIPLSLSGAALVWDEAIDHGLNPQRYAVGRGGAVDPQRYVAAARAVLRPGEAIVSLSRAAGGPIVIAASQPGKPLRGGPPGRTMLWLDPPTARILDRASSATGLFRVLHNLHGNLLVPGVGRLIVGWIGVAMAVSCFTGVWLWWPTAGRWVRGLRWRRHRHLDTNLHHLTGFWIALPLFVLSVTGVWIAFPQVFGGAMAGGGGPGTARPQPLAAPHLSLGTVIAGAQAVRPGDWRQLSWPTDRKPAWSVAFAGDGATVSVDDASGAAKVEPVPRETLARLMRRLHDGTRMGIVWQAIIFLGGLIPALLAVTGIIMWWRARGWRSERKARRIAA